MKTIIKSHVLSGEAAAVSSKSELHRLLICASLADKPTKIKMNNYSQDIDATVRCIRAMGAQVKADETSITVYPLQESCAVPNLDCGESGSSFRFLLPVAASLFSKSCFIGSGRLPDRPIGELANEMSRHGVSFSSKRLPLEICGRLQSGEYKLPGNVSSQYITGLLLALPMLDGDSSLTLTSKTESESYIKITLSVLSRFGINADITEDGYHIKGNQRFISPGSVTADGDWSNSAFFLASGAIGQVVTVKGLNMSSAQGDREIVNILKKFGADVRIFDDSVTVLPSRLTSCEADISDIPDLLPVLSVVAAYADGETRFTGGARLRLKESDRLFSCASMINSLGGKAKELPDGLIVIGTGGLHGGTVDSFGDHRIVMASAAASAGCKESVIINGSQAVSKSYPTFFEDFKGLGGIYSVI